MKIIIAEADRELCSDLCARLRKRLPAGSLEVVDDGRGLMERVLALHPVLVVLDTLLPGRDGLSLLHD
ncbi:MAG: response regulator transcription factor, partial [Butyricicoccaceae bacterium]